MQIVILEHDQIINQRKLTFTDTKARNPKSAQKRKQLFDVRCDSSDYDSSDQESDGVNLNERRLPYMKSEDDFCEISNYPIVQIREDGDRLTLLGSYDCRFDWSCISLQKYNMLETSSKSIYMFPTIQKIVDHYFQDQKEQKAAKACIALLLISLAREELTVKAVDAIIGHVMRIKQSFPLLQLSRMLIDTVDFLAFKRLNQSVLRVEQHLYAGKFTACRLTNNLPDIIKECFVLKVTTPKSGEGGNHIYVKATDIDSFLAQHQRTMRQEQAVLHMVQSTCNRLVLDIDIKRDQFPNHWHLLQKASFEGWFRAISILKGHFDPIRLPNTQPIEPVLTMYKNEEKISLRAVLGILCEVDFQRKFLVCLQTAHSTNAILSEHYTDHVDIRLLAAVLIRSADTAPLQIHASMRLPFQGKLLQSSSPGSPAVYSYDRVFTTNSSQNEVQQQIQYIKACLPIHVQSYRSKLPIKTLMPIIPFHYQPTQTKQITTNDIVNAYMSACKVQTVDVINISKSLFQFCIGSQSPYCPICLKEHCGDKQVQHCGYFNKNGFVINCASKGFSKEHVYLLIKRQSTQSDIKQTKKEQLNESQLEEKLIHYFQPDCEDDSTTKTAQLINDYLDSLIDHDLELIDDKFITDAELEDTILSRKLVCIKSPMGSGKTELLTRLIIQHDWSNILWLSSRKSYTLNMLNRLNDKSKLDFKCYDDKEHIAKTIRGGRLLCQIDSIGRVAVDTFQILILDEIMSLIQQIESKPSLFTQLTKLILNADLVLCFDAQFEMSLFNLFQNIAQLHYDTNKDLFYRPLLVYNQFKPFSDREVSVYTNDLSRIYERSLCAKIIQTELKLGINVFGYISTIQQQTDLKTALIHLGIKEEEIMIINSTVDLKVRERFFLNIEEAVKPFKVLLTTACVTIGVDINNDHFKSAVGVFTHGTASAQQFLQAIHRPRQLENLYLFIQDDTNKPVFSSLDLDSQAVFKTSKFEFIESNSLHQYQHLYQLSIEAKPLSYIMHYIAEMGYVNNYPLIIEQPEFSIIRDPKKKTLVSDVTEDQHILISYVRFLADYLKYDQLPDFIPLPYNANPKDTSAINRHKENQDTRANQRILDQQEFQSILSLTDQVICQDLIALFNAAGQLFAEDVFSRYPQSLFKVKENCKIIRNLQTYMKALQIPLETLLKVKKNWEQGFIFRKARDIHINDPSLPNAQILQKLHESISHARSLNVLALTKHELNQILGNDDGKYDPNLVKRDIRQQPVKHAEEVKRIPEADAYQQRYRYSAIAGSGTTKTAFVNLSFDQGFLFYTPTSKMTNEERLQMMHEQKALYDKLRLNFIFCN